MNAIQVLCIEQTWVTFTMRGVMYKAKEIAEEGWGLFMFERRQNCWREMPIDSPPGRALRDYVMANNVPI